MHSYNFLFFALLCILNGTLPFYHRIDPFVEGNNSLFRLEPKRVITKAVNVNSKALIGYWGQAKSRNLSPLQTYAEIELETLCTTSPFQFIYLSFLRDFNTLENLPGLDFSFHCQFPTDAALPKYKTMKSASGFGPLRCPKIETGIRTCQNLAPMVKFPPTIAIATANNVWNLFFGGNHTLRPFGSAILDGIDFSIRTNDIDAYGPFLKELKRIANLNNFNLGVTASPRCIFPDGFFGPTSDDRLLSPPNATNSDPGTLHLIDTINVYFTTTPLCSYGGNGNFLSLVATWSDFAQRYNKTFFITLPGFGYGYEKYFEAIPGDFVPISNWLDGSFIDAMPPYWHGVSFFDVSADSWSFPCQSVNFQTVNIGNLNLTSKSKYSDFVTYALSNSFQRNSIICNATNYASLFSRTTTSSSISRSTSSSTTSPGMIFSSSSTKLHALIYYPIFSLIFLFFY